MWVYMCLCIPRHCSCSTVMDLFMHTSIQTCFFYTTPTCTCAQSLHVPLHNPYMCLEFYYSHDFKRKESMTIRSTYDCKNSLLLCMCVKVANSRADCSSQVHKLCLYSFFISVTILSLTLPVEPPFLDLHNRKRWPSHVQVRWFKLLAFCNHLALQ